MARNSRSSRSGKRSGRSGQRQNQRGGEAEYANAHSKLPLQTGGDPNNGTITNGLSTNGNKLEISPETMAQAKTIAEGLLQNLGNSQKGGGEVSAYEAEKGLHGSALSGGARSRSRASRRGGSKSSRRQRGGMMPGVMTAVETALVPLGLYLGQKALQSRSSKGKASYKSFSNRFSRRSNRGRK
jgi:hypothetical protein